MEDAVYQLHFLFDVQDKVRKRGDRTSSCFVYQAKRHPVVIRVIKNTGGNTRTVDDGGAIVNSCSSGSGVVPVSAENGGHLKGREGLRRRDRQEGLLFTEQH